MKRRGLLLCGALVVLGAVEWGARWHRLPVSTPAGTVVVRDSLRCLAADLDQWVDGAAFCTDAAGHRLLHESADTDAGTLLVLGGEFSAAYGIRDEDHFARRLVDLLVEHGGAARGRLRVEIVSCSGPWPERAAAFRAAVERVRPKAVVLQLEAADFGYDATTLRSPAPAGARFELPGPAGLALLDLARRSRFERQVGRAERAAEELVARDGFTARAIETGREEFLHFQGAMLQGAMPSGSAKEDDWVVRLGRRSLAEDFGVLGVAQAQESLRYLRGLLEEWERTGTPCVVLETDPPFFFGVLRAAESVLHVARVTAPPWWWDEALRIEVGGVQRPTAIVHLACAGGLLVRFAELGAFPDRVGNTGPENLVEREEEIAAFHRRAMGHELEIHRLLRERVPERIEFRDRRTAVWRLGGIDEEGRFLGAAPCEVVLQKGVGPARLEFEVEGPPSCECSFPVALGTTDRTTCSVSIGQDGRGRGTVELQSSWDTRTRVGIAISPPAGVPAERLRMVQTALVPSS